MTRLNPWRTIGSAEGSVQDGIRSVSLARLFEQTDNSLHSGTFIEPETAESKSPVSNFLDSELTLLSNATLDVPWSRFIDLMASRMTVIAELGPERFADVAMRLLRATKDALDVAQIQAITTSAFLTHQELDDFSDFVEFDVQSEFLYLVAECQLRSNKTPIQVQSDFWIKILNSISTFNLNRIRATFLGLLTSYQKLDADKVERDLFSLCKCVDRFSLSSRRAAEAVNLVWVFVHHRQVITPEMEPGFFSRYRESGDHRNFGEVIWNHFRSVDSKESSRGRRRHKISLGNEYNNLSGQVLRSSPSHSAQLLRQFEEFFSSTLEPFGNFYAATNYLVRAADLVLESPILSNHEECQRCAINLLFEGIRWCPTNRGLWARVPRAASLVGANALAEFSYWECTRRFPEDVGSWIRIADFYLEKDQPNLSEEALRDAIVIHPEQFAVHWTLAKSVARQEGRLEEAREILRNGMIYNRRGYNIRGYRKSLNRQAGSRLSDPVKYIESIVRSKSENDLFEEVQYFDRQLLRSGRLRCYDFLSRANEPQIRKFAIKELRTLVSETLTPYGVFLISKNLDHIDFGISEVPATFESQLMEFLRNGYYDNFLRARALSTADKHVVLSEFTENVFIKETPKVVLSDAWIDKSSSFKELSLLSRSLKTVKRGFDAPKNGVDTQFPLSKELASALITRSIESFFIPHY